MVGIRACSNILAIMADRWESSKDLRDVFELLATEIPMVENVPSNYQHCISERAIKSIGNDTVLEIRSKLPHVRSVVINREILRMIEEMITEDLPSVKDSSVGIVLDIGNQGLTQTILYQLRRFRIAHSRRINLLIQIYGWTTLWGRLVIYRLHRFSNSPAAYLGSMSSEILAICLQITPSQVKWNSRHYLSYNSR
jgi:hypothetical protein